MQIKNILQNYKLFIALRYLKGRKNSPFSLLVVLFSVGGIFIGVAALIIVTSVMNGFEREIRSRIIGMTAHITLYPIENNIKNWQSVGDKIKNDKDIVAYSPFVLSKVGVIGKDAIDAILLKGVITDYEKNVSDISTYLTVGKYDFSHPDSSLPPIVMGNFLAQRLNLDIDDTVQLIYPKGKTQSFFGVPATNQKKFILTGILNVGLYEYDSEIALVSLKDAQNLLGMNESVTGIEVKTKDFYKANKISKKIAERIGLPYYTITWAETNKNLFSWITIEKWTMFLLLSLIIGVAAFNIISNLIMVVIEKTREIGILKALGVSSKDIMRIFVLQAMLLGGIGTFLGGLVGITICLIQEHYKIISLPPEIYSISALPVDTRGLDILFIIVFAFLIILFASIYPARKASKMMPIDAIRYG